MGITKKITALVIAFACILSGCSASFQGPSSSASKVRTENGETQGYDKKTSKGKGSASFNINGKHVEMTNFSYEAAPDSKVQAAVVESDIIYATSLVYSGEDGEEGDVWQAIVDGHYPEKFTPEKIVDQMNDLYRITANVKASPVQESDLHRDGNVIYALLPAEEDTDDDCAMLFITENESDKYAIIEWTDLGHNTEDIVRAAYEALSGSRDIDVGGLQHPDNARDISFTESVAETGNKLNPVKNPTEAPRQELTPAKGTNVSLVVGGVIIESIEIPKESIVDMQDYLIQTIPEDGLRVNYSDSYINVGDDKSLQEAVDSINKAWEVNANKEKFEYNGMYGYLVTWDAGECNCVRVYQPIEGASTYLMIDISDHNKKHDAWDLANAYCIAFNESDPAPEKSLDTGAKGSANPDLTLKIDGVVYKTIYIPNAWVTAANDTLIQTNPEPDVYVNYSDSYTDIGDLDEIRENKESVDATNHTSASLEQFECESGNGYILAWETDGWKCARVYMPVKGAGTYLMIDITDYGKTYDAWEIAEKYCVKIEK